MKESKGKHLDLCLTQSKHRNKCHCPLSLSETYLVPSRPQPGYLIRGTRGLPLKEAVLLLPRVAPGLSAQSVWPFCLLTFLSPSVLARDAVVLGLCGRHIHISYLARRAGIKMHFGSPRTIKKKKEALSH